MRPDVCRHGVSWFLIFAVLSLLLVDASADEGLPPYVRGKNYRWILKESERENGITYMGAAERLRTALNRLKKGEKIKVVTIGGSITAGQGCVDAPNWPEYLFNYLQDKYGPDKVTGSNGAVAGTLSSYMSVCHNMHVPKDADIVFVEYTVNDFQAPNPTFTNNIRRGFERLLRKLHLYPKRPAVVMVNSYIWYTSQPFEGAYWNNAEREFSEFQSYYHIPAVSVKACCYQKMVANEPGFSVQMPRHRNQHALKGVSFYFDPIHPDGVTGARVTAELAMHLVDKVVAGLTVKPLSPEEEAVPPLKLPQPMIPNNFESVSDKCFISQHFTDTVVGKDGWEWINESKTERPKWGFVSKVPGSVLKIKIDTRATAAPLTAGGTAVAGQAGVSTGEVLVELAYLKSYEHMGKAKVECVSGCTCNAPVLDGHCVERNSQLHLFNFYVSQAAECIIAITVLPETTSGEHKIKIAGVMLSEEAGHQDGIRNTAAVEYVHDISSRGGAIFEVKNHAL
eukprot:CAMPEP_0202891718 /NCGR_PEP_ID=MMETSP1392-20130828/1712_1 /ASSEMBLY_ACC=CAM_ASM_000868 /TAXON_ID=225041 /ORGANISM="Chlamydomonas chlamydogama, Strain SAG 11-48b" /LENGTH=508 /DNA_ID=CAMNT_0049575555 /DNA_START=27 /DNA_END=1553 /DNA_ORIENTATION=+